MNNDAFKKTLLFVLLVMVLFVFYQVFVSLKSSEHVDEGFSVFPGEQARAVIGKQRVVLDVADTLEERRQGLSGLKSLSRGHGLLFVFDNPGRHGIWMKDMNFSIDILWIDSNLSVVSIEEGVDPASYPEVFKPEADASYVIEVNKGFVESAGVSRGDRIVIEGL